jgi:L-fuconolactonase
MDDKRDEGRDEPIIDPDIPIIDAHIHLFDRRPVRRYMLQDYLADASAGHRIVASVYVESLAFARRDGPEALRPLGEIEFANGVGAMAASGVYGDCRVAAAIVGYADLRTGDEVAGYLDLALELAPQRLRGIRQVTVEDPTGVTYRYMMNKPPTGIMRQPGFRPGFGHLASRGLVFDEAVFQHQIPEVAELADAFPDATIVLNHMGIAMALEMGDEQRAEVFRQWRDNIRDIARRPNVYCMIGGMGMPQWGFGFEHRRESVGYQLLADSWRPYVETTIEAFGVDRCMMESNYPPDGRSCGFVPLWNALKHIVRSSSNEAKTDLFSGTAARVYRLPVPTR